MHSRSTNVRSRQSTGFTQQKPTFNVNPPFMGVLMIQLNHAMSIELQKFIASVGDVEEEVYAFKSGLRDPAQHGVFIYKDGPSFLVTRSFKGVVMVEMNQEMRELMIQFISDIVGGVDKIIWAFKLALENPDGGREARSRRAVPDAGKRQRIRGSFVNSRVESETESEEFGDELEDEDYDDDDDDDEDFDDEAEDAEDVEDEKE